MPIPTAYTEEELKTYMLAKTGNLGTLLELTTASFDDAVVETLLAYGEDDIANAVDIPKLRALAKVQAWTVAVEASSGWYDFRSGQDQFDRETVHNQAKTLLAKAQGEAAKYADDDSYGIVVGRMVYGGSPYNPTIEE